ncbi:enolase C-terminal domain-like protein [Lentilactobacillus sp. Marseille-Q4993]|uniref:enolase C-terminal domain-like protein n=1 Tax=Lentilactobacillus sp. Marseille-Q4993 TaxID=3039492 RepID=UPI0024BC644F|nr:enolase C-terminal domain-like protein [Lentilactobacillus sp. Marseille-Q4993]
MSIPHIVKIDVYPVAGRDSMLLNLSGAHFPFFTRNIVVMTTNTDDIGVSEVPGGETITNTLNACKDLILGKPITSFKQIMASINHKYSQLDKRGRGNQTFDQRTTIHVITAVETALLDLLGKFLRVPVAELLGNGQQREEVDILGYLFYIGDSKKTDLDYQKWNTNDNSWESIRRQPALTPDAIVKQAKSAYKRYGFRTFKLKGGVLDGEDEVKTIKLLHRAFPTIKLDLDPNGAWSLAQATKYADELHEDLTYIEDPCGAENGFSGREIMAEFQRLTNIPTATNMIATDWRQLQHALTLNSISIPLADPHFWTMEGSVEVAQLCNHFGLNWGIHSNNHFDISLAMSVNAAAAAPGNIYAIDTHWIWQDGQYLTKNPLSIKNGKISLPSSSIGLGVEIDFDALKRANQLYLEHKISNRDDSIAMQYLINNWKFDPKKPAMVR